MSKKIIFILCITLLAAVLRFYRLGEVPAGFHRDEAFLGYNAYSLLKNGTDMTGNVWPLHFESFLYSPGGYSYLSAPFIALFNLSPFSVRFASAFFGTLTIPLFYFITLLLFRKKNHQEILSIMAALLLAITPWHINLSRTSTENIIVVFLITLGTYLFLKYKNNSIHIYLAFFSFFTTLLIYQAPRAFLPLFIPLVFVFKYFDLEKNIKSFLKPLILFLLLIVLPVLLILKSPELSTRMKTVSIFSTEQTQLVIDEQIRGAGTLGINPILTRIMHNKIIGYADTFLSNYFQHLSYPFLFTDKGLPDRYRVPYSGILYFTFLPLMIVGCFWLWSKHKQIFLFLIGWVSIGFLGSALTFDDVPNLQRTLIVFPALILFPAAGLTQIVEHKKYRFLLISSILVLLTIETSRYLYNYNVQQLIYRPWYRQEGYKQLVETVESYASNYKSIVITNRESAPAIFFLFFTKYNPKTYIEEIKHSSLRDFDRVNFSRYTFSEEECPLKEIVSIDQKTGKEDIECFGEKKTLYVNAGTCKLPTICGNVLKEITRNDGTRVFTVVEAR